MEKNKINKILAILLVLSVIFIFSFTYLDMKQKETASKLEEINNSITKLEDKINDVEEQDSITRALLNAHLTNQLSKDYGGE